MEQVLYKLPEGWQLATIGSVLSKVVTGKTPSTSKAEYFSSNEVDWFTPSDFGASAVLGNSRRKLSSLAIEDGTIKKMPKGSVLLVAIGATIGKVGLAENESCFNQQVTGMYFNEEIHPKYAYYWLSYIKPEVIAKSSQATLPIINQTGIKSLTFLYPSNKEQKRIVEKLDALLIRIDTAIELLQKNLISAKSLLASALFEKFHQEVNPTLIKDIFHVHNGRAYKQQELLNTGKYKVIRIQNLKGGENYYYSDLELDDNKYCESGDLLFSWSGTPGSSFGAFIWDDEKAIYHYHIWKMEPKIKIDPRYAYWLLKDVTEEAIANARGVAGMLHITKGTMESFIVSMPDYETQQKIANELDELASKSEQLQIEISSKIGSLKNLKASILDSAFKGEL